MARALGPRKIHRYSEEFSMRNTKSSSASRRSEATAFGQSGRRLVGKNSRQMEQQSMEDDDPLSPAEIRELERRIRDSRDPVRYMLVSEFDRRFILYYDVSSDTFVLNEPSRGTLFKRREAAESIKRLLSGGVSLVKYTAQGDKLKRLTSYRMRLAKRRSMNASAVPGPRSSRDGRRRG